MRKPPLSVLVRVVGTAVVALAGWVILGYLATVPLGAIFGWSGHPAMPDAPAAVYVGLYLVVLPVLCWLAAWKAVGLGQERLHRRR
jgi:hypothetical protein